jgi:RHS repeat-associated protein
VGNRTAISLEEPLPKTQTPATVNSNYILGNLLMSSGMTTYTYDPNGNLATKTQGSNVTNYTFDSQNRLTQVSSPSLNMQYQYDGLFNRASKTVSGTTTKFLVDPNGFLPQAIAEMDGSGNITGYYVYDGMGLVAKMTPSGNKYFYHFDGIGNTIAMTDASGNMVNKCVYDEFGNLLNSVEAVSNPFLFVGQYGVMDEDNGLLYMRARYYDPQVGRFISKDPIGYWGGINLYGYVENNPLNYFDPLGLFHYKKGVPPAGPETEAILRCMDNCLNRDLGISGGSEEGSGKDKHDPRYHPKGYAADISYRMNEGLQKEKAKVMCCAKNCGVQYAKIEGNHFHIQTHMWELNTETGRSIYLRGDLPYCGCDNNLVW